MDRQGFQDDIRLRTVPNLLAYAARTWGEKPFLRESGSKTWLSYADTLKTSLSLARGLANLGVKKGDYIPLMMPNCTEFVQFWFATNLRGAAYVAVNTSLVGDLLAAQFALGRARLWAVHAEFLPVLATLPKDLRASVEVLVVAGLEAGRHVAGWTRVVRLEDLFLVEGPDACEPAVWSDVCAVGFTSGTTGPSKGVMAPHSLAVATALSFSHVVNLRQEDTLYTSLPLFHGMSSRMGMLPALLTGCRIVLGKRFSGSQFWSEVINAEATVAQTIFSIPGVLMAQPPGPQDRAHRVTRMFNAHHTDAFQKRFGVQLLESFAMSEIGMVTASSPSEQRAGSAGRAHPDWDVGIVDEDGVPVPDGEAGEIVCRPRRPGLMMRGYLHQPERTVEATRDLWFRSGDIAYRDSDGYIWFLDRAKERIRRRGENISSLEIEQIVRRHPDLEDAAAIAHPAEAGEDDIRLMVVPRPGRDISPADLHAWLLANLPRFMVARYIEIVPHLPYTATNKVEKARLMAQGLGPDAWDAEAFATLAKGVA
jgi:crotonobetaine/carnitine-CoA ligase